MPVEARSEAKQTENDISRLIEHLLASNLRLRIQTDAETGSFVYQGIDRKTGEVKSQWPTEKILSLRAFLRSLDGLLVDKTA